MKLQNRVTLLIFTVLVGIGSVGGGAALYYQRQAAISGFEQSASLIAAVLEKSIEGAMLRDDPKAVQGTVTNLATSPSIKEVSIISNTGKVYASGDIVDIGTINGDPQVAHSLMSAQPMVETKNVLGRNEVTIALPINNTPDCSPCHGSSPVLGAVIIGVDRSSLDAQIRSQATIMLLMGGVTFAGIWLALFLLFRREVSNPISSLVATANKIAHHDFKARAEVKNKNEIGALGQAFNGMAEKLENYSNDLEYSKKELEERVLQRTEELSTLYKELQERDQIRGDLLGRILTAQETERKRIARDLHDESAQALTMVMMDLSRTTDSLPSSMYQARQKLSQSRTLVSDSLDNLRKLIQDLRPEVLDQLGLIPAIRSYAANRLKTENVAFNLVSSGLDDRLPPQIETPLFRIIQEAVNNVIRHSGATAMEIRIVRNGRKVNVLVKDNGTGFDVNTKLKNLESWGLRGIQERVVIIGGELHIESSKANGTIINIEITLKGDYYE